MEIRTDRLGLLLDQLDTSLGFAKARLDGLTDEEYLWEPTAGMWSIRRRQEARTSRAYGAGEWLLDFEPADPRPAPLTTIAWRLGHLTSMFWGRWEWTFGERRRREDAISFSPTATEALDRFWELVARWRDGVAGLTDEQLDMVGFGQFPTGLDPQLPFIGIVWWQNRAFIHHTAEIALLRDLWAARGGGRFGGDVR